MGKLTHFNQKGEAHMVDIGEKSSTHRVAIADGRIKMLPETLKHIESGTHKKGDVLGIARIAGIMAHVETTGKTGVEMEALQAVQTSLLTIYDMCKSVDRGMTIESIGLLEKSGGKSGKWTRDK